MSKCFSAGHCPATGAGSKPGKNWEGKEVFTAGVCFENLY